MNYLEWWSSATEASTAARASSSHSWRWTTRTAEFIIPVLRFLSLGERGEAVGESEHSIASQRVVDCILDVACRLCTEDVLLLSEDVIHRKLD